MEKTIMYGYQPQLTIDLARLEREDTMRRASQRQLALEAKAMKPKRAGVIAGSRRLFGGAIISLGQAVRGERLEAAEAATVNAATLRLAR